MINASYTDRSTVASANHPPPPSLLPLPSRLAPQTCKWVHDLRVSEVIGSKQLSSHLASRPANHRGRKLRPRPTERGGDVLLTAVICQSGSPSVNRQSLCSAVQRLSVQSAGLQHILAATHKSCHGQPCGCEKAWLTSGGRVLEVVYSTITSAGRNTIDSGQSMILQRQHGPLPSSAPSSLRASMLTTIAAALSRCRAFASFGAAGCGF